TPAAPAEDFGFFEPLYEALVPAANDAAASRQQGRRATDAADAEGMPTGRRATDKVAVSAEGASIRVNIEKVDPLINLVGELVITQAMLAQVVSKVDPVVHEALLKGMGQLERNTRDLQESVMAIRMMPISFAFSRFPRLVHDLAQKLGKEVELRMSGE